MSKLEPIRAIPGLSLVRTRADKLGVRAAVHEPLSTRINAILGLKAIDDLYLRTHEINLYYGVAECTMSTHSRYFFFTSGAFAAVVLDTRSDEMLAHAIEEGPDELRPVTGLLVPSQCYVGFQPIHPNRSSYGMLSYIDATESEPLSIRDPRWKDLWRTVPGVPIQSETGEWLTDPVPDY